MSRRAMFGCVSCAGSTLNSRSRSLRIFLLRALHPASHSFGGYAIFHLGESQKHRDASQLERLQFIDSFAGALRLFPAHHPQRNRNVETAKPGRCPPRELYKLDPARAGFCATLQRRFAHSHSFAGRDGAVRILQRNHT
jgi:hypothetical protein